MKIKNGLSSSMEDYLREIYVLTQKKDEVRVTDVAQFLGISKPSVNRAMNTLKEQGYIEHEHYGTIHLTKAGLEAGKNVYDTYKVVYKFLTEMLEIVSLKGFEKRKPDQLSGGQQQRVAIARALVTEPSLLLADEPTGNLDSHSGKEVMKILHELNDEGRTIILITHDNEIAEEGTRVVRISDGRIIEDRPSNRV